MADGTIKIDIDVDGKKVDIASRQLDNLEHAGIEAGKGVQSTEDGLKDAGKESEKASSKIKKFATALGLVAIGAAAFSALKSSMDTAIARFDTLNKFPKVLQALGVSAEESEQAMNKLSDGIDGLPTTLDEIASTAQRMYTSFNDMDKAADTALALNNALLGSGSSAADAQRGTEQYLQALQRGKFEMEEWKTLQETMDIGLIKVAESFGYAGKTAKQDLYNALKDNTITMEQFNDKLIEVGTGTGIMAKLAKENSLGIATSLSNLKNAAAKGIANIIDSFNKLSKEVTGKEIAQNIDGMKKVVNASFKVIGKVIEGTAPIIKGFVSIVKSAIPIVKALSPAIIGLAVAYGSYVVITKATTAIEASNKALKTAMASTQVMTLLNKKQTVSQILSTNATLADIVAKRAQLSTIKLSSIATGVMTGAISASTAVKVIATGVTYAFAAAIRFLLGPVGLVIGAIGLLVTGVTALIKWLNKSTAEARKLEKETEKLGESTEELSTSINDTVKSYEKNQSEIKATAKANQDLAKTIEDLAKKENKSVAEKKLLNDYIEQLNGSVEGLNLSYNEEADALSMSSEQLRSRIDLIGEQASYNAALERQVEISKQQNEIDQQLEEINKLRAESTRLHDEEKISKSDHKEETEKLNEAEAALKETSAQLAQQYQETEEQITSSMAAVTAATESGVDTQVVKFEELSDEQQKAIDSMKEKWQEYQDKATDMFDVLSDKIELSAKDMTENLKKNQRIMSEWADNIAKLAERGVDQGLLDKLREAGPESAGHVKALVQASDKELEELNKAFSNAGKTSTEAFEKSLDENGKAIMDALGHLVTGAGDNLRKQIKDANFESIGIDVSKGLGGGIEKGTSDVEKATRTMAEKAIHSTKQELSIHSPSRVYKEIGEHTTSGLVLGIASGTAKVINTMRTLAMSMITPYKDTKSKFKSIGGDAMSGLNQGLLNGKGKVMSTARSIANEVASTMKSALRIHSPSRLMRDEIGKMIPDGIVLGIQANANKVGKEMNRVADMIITTPEQALGVSRMAYTNGNVDAIRSTNTASSNTGNTFDYERFGQAIAGNLRGDAIMDGYAVGQIQWRYVKDNIDFETNRDNNFK